jgi:hypothetical protein
MLQLHEMQIHLNPKHNISAMGAVINCTLICKENHQAGCGIQDSVEQFTTCITASVYVSVEQLIGGCQATQLEIQVFNYL